MWILGVYLPFRQAVTASQGYLLDEVLRVSMAAAVWILAGRVHPVSLFPAGVAFFMLQVAHLGCVLALLTRDVPGGAEIGIRLGCRS